MSEDSFWGEMVGEFMFCVVFVLFLETSWWVLETFAVTMPGRSI